MAAVRPKAHAEALLLKADKSHGIHAGPKAVQSALDHVEDESLFSTWVLRHLEADNLLTPDELAIYTELDRTGKVDALSGMQDLTQAQGVSEDEVRIATEELKRSTTAINQQTEILKLQAQALDRAVQKKSGNDRRRQDLEIVQRRKLDNEHKHLAGELESMSYGIEHRLKDLSEDTVSSVPAMQAAVRDVLESDDKLLASLQKLGKELDCQDPNEADMVEKMRDICLRLIKTTVETVRTKLDRVYLEALATAAYQHHEESPNMTEVKALGDEVESLYAEILPVAQMSVEQQRLDPAIKRVSARDGQSLHRSAIALQYVSDCLTHLYERSECLATQIEAAGKHHEHSNQLLGKAREELSASTSPPAPEIQPAIPASPVRRPSPVRMRAKGGHATSRRRSSGIPDIPAVDTLCENLGINELVEHPTAASRFKQLGQVLDERSRKGDDISKNAQDSYEAITTSHLDDLRLAVQFLGDNVLAETAYREVKFVDADFEASIDVLKSEVEQARESLSRLEMKHIGKKSERKEDLVNRWTA